MLTPGRFALGSIELGVVIGAAWLGASALRARFAPTWHGLVARVAEANVVLALIVIVEQALGTFGLLREWFVVLTIAAIGLALRRLLAARGGQKRPARAARTPSAWRRVSGGGAVLAVAITVGQWSDRIGSVLDGGITSFDSAHYHLPFAARFAQTGSTAHIQFVTPEFPDAYHHMNAELFHALGMIVFHHDVPSVFLNLAFVGLAIAAGYCVGDRWGEGPLAVIGLCVVLASPVMGLHHAGTATNDVVVLAFVLSTAALLLHSDGGVGGLALAGLCAGMAFGTKLTAVAIAIVLVLAVPFLARRGQRLVSLAWAAGLAALPAIYWLVRNLADSGNPAPGVELPFFTTAPFRTLDDLGYSIAHYATSTDVWRQWFFRGLRIDLGRAWPLVLIVVVASSAVALLSRDTATRVVGAGAVAGGLFYLVTPTTALGPVDQPLLFASNVRYAAPVLALGLTLVPSHSFLRRDTARWIVAGVLALALVVAQFSAGPFPAWPTAHRALGFVVAVAVVAAAFAWRRAPRTTVAVGVGLLVVLAYPVAHHYDLRRYSSDPASVWANSLHGAHIAIAGFYPHFDLFGRDLTNDVQYVGAHAPHGAFHEITSCPEWRQALRDGKYDHVVLSSQLGETGVHELQWTSGDPAASLVLTSGPRTVYRFDGRVADPGC